MGVVDQHDGGDASGIQIEIEYIGTVERYSRAVFQTPVVEIVGDRAHVPLGAHQHVVHGELAAARRLRDLGDVLADVYAAQERRLDPGVGGEQRGGSIHVARLEGLQVLADCVLHLSLRRDPAHRPSAAIIVATPSVWPTRQYTGYLVRYNRLKVHKQLILIHFLLRATIRPKSREHGEPPQTI